MINNLAKKVTRISLSEDWEVFQSVAGRDALKELRPISIAEYNYYENLKIKERKII